MNSDLNKQKLLLFVVFIFCILFSSFSFSQNATSSPYSRYGIGEITNKGFSQNFAMGGTVVAMQSDTIPYFFINTGNPASYSNVRLTTADLGINYTRLKLSSTAVKSTVNSASIGYVAMAVPLKKWCGASVGLIPYSSVGYKVSDKNEVNNVGVVNYLYEGNGGLNQLYLGFGFKPFFMHSKSFSQSKKYSKLKTEKQFAEIRKIADRRKVLQDLSFGANVSYLFGGIENTRRTIFPTGSLSFFNAKATTNTRINDVYIDYGMQYAYTFDSLKHRDLKENVKIMFGATYSAQTNLNAKIDSLSVTYFNNSVGTEIIKDTVELTENTKGSITFPMSFGFGIGIKKGEKILVSADFAMQNWSSYQVFNQSQGLKNSMRVSLGTQFIPDYKATGKNAYFKRIHYRAGIRYAQTALELKSTQLTEYAGSLGIALPVARRGGYTDFGIINIGIELGQRGTTTNGLIKENFFKATVGFTINDKWFIQRKFD